MITGCDSGSFAVSWDADAGRAIELAVAFVLKITSSVRSHNNDKNFVEGYKCGPLPAAEAQV
jgi:hypothetical protein